MTWLAQLSFLSQSLTHVFRHTLLRFEFVHSLLPRRAEDISFERMPEWSIWGMGSETPRFYMIPLESDLRDEGPLAPLLGHRNRVDRSTEDVLRALDRAQSGEFHAVIFPSAWLRKASRPKPSDASHSNPDPTHPQQDLDHAKIRRACQERKLKIIHQLTADFLEASRQNPDVILELLRSLDAGDALNVVFAGHASINDSMLARLTRHPDQVYFTLSPRVGDPVLETLHRLQPFVRQRLFFHFPYHLEAGDGCLSVEQVHQLIHRIHTRVPGIKVRPPLGCEIFDPRVDPELELEPLHKPVFELRCEPSTPSQDLDVSVVIPSYNNEIYLANTVRHLLRQDLPRSQFEVIVVDDGSTDQSQDRIRQLVAAEAGRLNFKYVHSPRLKPRRMGDANYRAGISRNLGVKHARGRLLLFLDSDILTPQNFLRDLIAKHDRFDVIQCKRVNLIESLSHERLNYEDVNVTRDTFTTEDGYWERFHALKDWMALPFFWKYTCTYGLSMPLELFKRVGWIKRNFVFYGFEDVELGYRLARAGCRFHLNDVTTYHLFHRNERSEFRNNDYLRQSLLAKTAQIFYLNLLEPEVFHHFRGLMKEQIPLTSYARLLFTQSGLRRGASALRRWLRPAANWAGPRFQNGLARGRLASTAAKLLSRAGGQWWPRLSSRWAPQLGRITWPLLRGPHRLYHFIKLHAWRLKLPFLAIWNWRWYLWRTWGRMKFRAWKLGWFLSWPIRKLYYFSRFQLEKRNAQRGERVAKSGTSGKETA